MQAIMSILAIIGICFFALELCNRQSQGHGQDASGQCESYLRNDTITGKMITGKKCPGKDGRIGTRDDVCIEDDSGTTFCAWGNR